MAIKIGHASSDERGQLKNGQAGDQNKRECYIRAWYNRPWNVVLRAKTKPMAEKIAKCMELACENDLIGYDQNQRNTLLTQARGKGYDPSKVNVPCETDCSALVSLCCIFGGVPETVVFRNGNSCTTRTLKPLLTATGLFEVLVDKKYLTSDKWLKRGDILLYEGHHTAIALEDGDNSSENQITIKEYYTIQSGDTLGKIAKAYNTKAKDIQALNSDLIKDINKIKVGWKIRVR